MVLLVEGPSEVRRRAEMAALGVIPASVTTLVLVVSCCGCWVAVVADEGTASNDGAGNDDEPIGGA